MILVIGFQMFASRSVFAYTFRMVPSPKEISFEKPSFLMFLPIWVSFKGIVSK